MKNILSITVLLIFSISLGESELLDYRLAKVQNSPRETCPQPGAFCSACDTASICFANGNGGWDEMVIATCAWGQTCLDGRCITSTNPVCSPTTNLDFRCVTSGLFPNPGDCEQYHYCVPSGSGLEEVRVACTNGYYYNPKTTYCDRKLVNSACSAYPVPLCKAAGEEAPLRENPTIFYTCVPDSGALYPVQQSCENGKIFSVANRCR